MIEVTQEHLAPLMAAAPPDSTSGRIVCCQSIVPGQMSGFLMIHLRMYVNVNFTINLPE